MDWENPCRRYSALFGVGNVTDTPSGNLAVELKGMLIALRDFQQSKSMLQMKNF
jgi:hypothetical protein